MKLLTIITALIAANISYACPNLSGKYTCVEKEGNRDIEITQTQDNEVTSYNIQDNGGSITIIADGTEKPETTTIVEDTETFVPNHSATCEYTTLFVHLKMNEKEIDKREISIQKVGEVLKSNSLSSLNGKVVKPNIIYCVPRNISENI